MNLDQINELINREYVEIALFAIVVLLLFIASRIITETKKTRSVR